MVRRLPLLVPLLVLLALLPSAPAAAAGDGIVRRAVSFEVQNVNRSKVPCDADGKTYTVRGHLTGPRAALADPGAVTLFLHGLSYGEFFTTYGAQPGYDFARKQAADGHVTVTVDRLGYDSSDRPQGLGICVGSRADVAHQIVQQLKTGRYATTGVAPAFDRVVLAGHSLGALITSVAAFSFDGIDGIGLLSYSDDVVSPGTQKALRVATAACEKGGEPADGDSGPSGYVWFGAETAAQFVAAHFFTPNADRRVVDATAAMRNRDPCGDILSFATAVAVDKRLSGTIDVPALVLIGGKDAIFPTPAQTQARRLTGSPSVTTVTLPNVGHALTLHDPRNVFQGQMSLWLSSQGFGG